MPLGRPTTAARRTTPLLSRDVDVEKMAPPSTLDLFMLTFNCAKNLINPGIFAAHLQGAFGEGGVGVKVPDLVVFSLQEVAPLSYSFIGSYFLNPYYARYEEALNIAAAGVLTRQDGEMGGNGRKANKRPYTLVRAKNVGMTAILLFARDPTAVQSIEEAECGFGAADMGNKGAVGLRVVWGEQGAAGKSTEVTLVATHLAAMEWNLKKRNANWRSIMSGLSFGNPQTVAPGLLHAPGTKAKETAAAVAGGTVVADSSSDSSDADIGEDEDAQPLLTDTDESSLPQLTPDQQAQLQDMSIFKPTSHLFVAGDLNYRISASTPPPLAPFPSFDPDSEYYYPNFLPRDQLTQERLAGRTFHGMIEPPITFGPTYKYNVQSSPTGADNEESILAGSKPNGIPEVPWKFAAHRWPGWCDRVLYLPLPAWVSSKYDIQVKSYNSLPVVKTSDHRPVFLRANIPLISPEEMVSGTAKALREARQNESGGRPEAWKVDPRVKPPIGVDFGAWERRAAARKKEMMVGWSAFLWSTREGAVLMATVVVLVVGGWWIWSVW